MRVVGVDNFGVTVSKIERRTLFPVVREAVNVDEFGNLIAVVGEQSECTARVDRLELCVVADQEHLCPSLSSELGDPVQRQRPRE